MKICSGDRSSVQFTVLITALHTPARVAHEHLYAFHAAQLTLVGTLQSVTAGVVASSVIVVAVDIALTHFAYGAQYMCGGFVGIVS